MRNLSRPSRWVFIFAGLVVALLLAGVVSYYASANPDGLTKVAGETGIAAKEQEHATTEWPLAGYVVEGIESASAAGGLAGVIGVAITFAIGMVLFFAVRGRQGASARSGGSAETRSPVDSEGSGSRADRAGR